MTGRHADRRSSHSGEGPRGAGDPTLDDRIGNRPPVWGSSADSPTGPIDVHADPTEFELAYSGGWGAPGNVDATGPIPRLGRRATSPEPDSAAVGTSAPAGFGAAQGFAPPGRHAGLEGQRGRAGREGGRGDEHQGGREGRGGHDDREGAEREDTVHGLPADTATTWHRRSSLPGDSAGPAPLHRLDAATSDHFVYSKSPGTPRLSGPITRGLPTVAPARDSEASVTDDDGPLDARLADGGSVTGLTDFGFRVRATRVLAPVAYGLLITLLVIGYVANVYTTAMAAATAGTGLVGVMITALVGLVAVAFGVVAGRIAIELACNVADLASRSDQ